MMAESINPESTKQHLDVIIVGYATYKKPIYTLRDMRRVAAFSLLHFSLAYSMVGLFFWKNAFLTRFIFSISLRR